MLHLHSLIAYSFIANATNKRESPQIKIPLHWGSEYHISRVDLNNMQMQGSCAVPHNSDHL